jgi:DedD protein
MNHLLDHDLEHDEAVSHGDREISLGPGTMLGIFFALAIVCGAFFGLGYSMGRHSGQNAPAPVIVSEASPAVTSAAKPTAGSASSRPAPVEAAPEETSSQPAVKKADAAIVGDKIAGKASPAPAPLPPAPAASSAGALPPIAPNGAFMVQVAAVSSKDIADIELAALKRFNYPVVVRHEPQDQLLHIQIGPFATKKDADAMRQNVLSHGFNAIVKQ